MVTWSPENADVGIQSLLFQIYQILLSTLLSVNRNQLTVTDARFAINATSSPLMMYLVVASVGDLFGTKTGLYKRIKSHRLIIRALGALVLPLWTGLSITISMSGKAFKDSPCHGSRSFVSWLTVLLLYFLYFFMFPGFLSGFLFVAPLVIFLPILFFLVFFSVRCWSQVVAGVQAYFKGVSGPWRLILCFTPLGWIILSGVFVKCAWCVPVATIL